MSYTIAEFNDDGTLKEIKCGGGDFTETDTVTGLATSVSGAGQATDSDTSTVTINAIA